jgi:hypothetical protein
MAISANTKMTAKVLMVAYSRAIEARSVKPRGEKRKFRFESQAVTQGTPLVRFGWQSCPARRIK